MSTIQEVIEAIKASSPESRVYVGCDSKRLKDGKVKYATVVILHINGKHGGKLFSFLDIEQQYGKATNPTLRLLGEATRAVDIARQIAEVVGDRQFELHLDLNTDPKYKSHDAVKQALGYVLGVLGFEAKLKPAAFAASSAADRLAG